MVTHYGLHLQFRFLLLLYVCLNMEQRSLLKTAAMSLSLRGGSASDATALLTELWVIVYDYRILNKKKKKKKIKKLPSETLFPPD